jgi:hypothetical protein
MKYEPQWEIRKCELGSSEQLSAANNGWEPFAVTKDVTNDDWGNKQICDIIWYKKDVANS